MIFRKLFVLFVLSVVPGFVWAQSLTPDQQSQIEAAQEQVDQYCEVVVQWEDELDLQQNNLNALERRRKEVQSQFDEYLNNRISGVQRNNPSMAVASVGILDRSLNSHPDPEIQEVIVERDRLDAYIAGFNDLPESAPIIAKYNETYSTVVDLRQRKALAKLKLEELKRNPDPTQGKIIAGEIEDTLRVPGPPEVQVEVRMITVSDAFFESIGVEFDVDDPYQQPPQLDRDMVTIAATGGFVGGGGGLYPGFGQEIETESAYFGGLEFRFRKLPDGTLTSGPNSPWQVQPAIEYTYVSLAQNGHRNVSGGGFGFSSGDVTYQFLGLGLVWTNWIDPDTMVLIDAKAGALDQKVSGNFHASGTTPAVKFGLSLQHKVSDWTTIGPYFSVLFPFGDVPGGAGPVATSRFEADPIFLFGVQLNYSMR